MSATWIGVDWGTTHLRAWVLDEGGAPVKTLQSDKGAGTLTSDGFEHALTDLMGEYLPELGQIDVICCGMVGAQQGWVPVPYRTTPAPHTPAAAEVVHFAAAAGRMNISILPGIAQSDPPDVMRGEETQIAGFFAQHGGQRSALCCPGTHSKWVIADAERIETFKTFPTGELFALLSRQSILRHSVRCNAMDRSAFLQGVKDAAAKPDQLVGQLFPLRAMDLLGQAKTATAAGRLSGLLIGTELANARPFWADQPVTVIGAGALAELYVAALSVLGVSAQSFEGDPLVRAGLTQARQRLRELAA